MKKLYKKYFGEIILAIGALSYSFEWYFIRNLYDLGYTSVDITFIKVFVGAMLVFLFYSIFNRKIYTNNKLTKKDYSILIILGLLTIFGNIFFNEAITKTSIANVLIILYLSVFWTFIMSIMFLKEKHNLKKIMYIFFAFAGVVMVLINNTFRLSFDLGAGELYALSVSLILAISIILTKTMSHIPAFYRFGIIFLFSSLMIIISIIQKNGFHYIGSFIDKEFLLYGSFLAITSGIMGRGLTDVGTKFVPASIVLVIMLLEPIGQITTGYFFANESINIINIIGMFIVFYTIIGISKKEDYFK